MTDTVSRQAVIDAVRSVPPGTTCRGDAIIAAINAIPAVGVLHPIDGMPKSGKRVYGDRTQPKTRIVAVTVTDEMVERAAMTHWNIGPELAWGELDQHDRDFLIKGMRVALVAALGE
jgi:hypothetical protein